MNRPDVPEILPAKHARPNLRQALAAGLRHADRPWSIGVDLVLLLLIGGVMCWEGWEFARDGEWEHLLAACACLTAGVLHMFRAFTDSPDRSETRR